MTDFGDKTSGDSPLWVMEDSVYASAFTMGAINGTSTSITATVSNWFGGGATVFKCVICDSSKNVLAVSDEGNLPTGLDWVTVNITCNLTASATYYLCVWCDAFTNLGYDSSGGPGIVYQTEPYDASITDPLTLGSTYDANGSLNIYCTYTETGGESAPEEGLKAGEISMDTTKYFGNRVYVDLTEYGVEVRAKIINQG